MGNNLNACPGSKFWHTHRYLTLHMNTNQKVSPSLRVIPAASCTFSILLLCGSWTLQVSGMKKDTEDQNMETDKMKLSSKISDSLWRGAPDSAKKDLLRQMRPFMWHKVSELFRISWTPAWSMMPLKCCNTVICVNVLQYVSNEVEKCFISLFSWERIVIKGMVILVSFSNSFLSVRWSCLGCKPSFLE